MGAIEIERDDAVVLLRELRHAVNFGAVASTCGDENEPYYPELQAIVDKLARKLPYTTEKRICVMCKTIATTYYKPDGTIEKDELCACDAKRHHDMLDRTGRNY